MSRFPDFLFQPSAGDKPLAGVNVAQITLSRWPGDDDEGHAACEFELRGSLSLTGNDAAALLAELLASFRTPPAAGGAA